MPEEQTAPPASPWPGQKTEDSLNALCPWIVLMAFEDEPWSAYGPMTWTEANTYADSRASDAATVLPLWNTRPPDLPA